MIKSTLFIAGIVLAGMTFGQVEVYNEDFQSGIPGTYTIVDNDGLTVNSAVSQFAPAWISLEDPDTSNAGDMIVGSTSYFDPAGQADRWLITPAITLGAYGNWAYWEGKSHDPSYPDSYKVLVSTTDTQLSSFNDTLEIVENELEYWTEHAVNFDSLTNNVSGMTVYLAFVNNTDDGFILYLDSIRVQIEDPSGLDELENVKFAIYPNPSSDFIQIASNQSITRINIFNLNGALVHTGTQEMIDIHGLKSGVYITEVHTEKGVGRKRLIKH